MRRSHRVLAITASACAALAFSSGQAAAQCLPQWLPGPFSALGVGSTDQPVDASVVWFDPVAGRTKLVIAGRFSTVAGGAFSRIAAWDGARWTPLGSGIGGFQVIGLTVFNGDVVATGNFTSAGGVPVSNVARYNGSSWQPMGSLNGAGFTLHVHNGELYVGGSFTSASGAAGTSRVARWNGASWVGVNGGTNGSVLDMDTYNGQLIIGGSFTTAGSAQAPRVARLVNNAWQSLSGLGPSDGTVYALKPRPEDGWLYLGGTFTAVGPVGTGGLARWNGGSWANTTGSFLGNVYSLENFRGQLVIAGFYPGLANSPSIAQWNGATFSNLGSGGLGPSGSGFTLTEYNDTLVLGGGFGVAGGVFAQNIALWAGGEWSQVKGGLSGDVYELRPSGNALYVGGDFAALSNDGFTINNVTVTTGAAFGQLAPLPNAINGTNGPVYALSFYSSSPALPPTLYAGGQFTQAGGLNALNIASFNTGGWGASGSGINGPVAAITQFGSRLVATGSFSTANGAPAANIALTGGVPWQGLGTGLGGPGRALAVYNGQLIVGGGFGSAGGVPGTEAIAAWTGSAWQALTGSNLFGSVEALTTFNGQVVAAGRFSRAGGADKWVGSWNGATWTSMSAGLPTSSVGTSSFSPTALAVHNNELYLAAASIILDGGSEPDPTDGAILSSIYRWTGSSWTPLLNAPRGPVYALASMGGSLWAGGGFTTSGGRYTPRLARLACPCYANCNNSASLPVLNALDFGCFLSQYQFAQTLPAAQQTFAYGNCDASTTFPVLNALDFSCFLQRYQAGCP